MVRLGNKIRPLVTMVRPKAIMHRASSGVYAVALDLNMSNNTNQTPPKPDARTKVQDKNSPHETNSRGSQKSSDGSTSSSKKSYGSHHTDHHNPSHAPKHEHAEEHVPHSLRHEHADDHGRSHAMRHDHAEEFRSHAIRHSHAEEIKLHAMRHEQAEAIKAQALKHHDSKHDRLQKRRLTDLHPNHPSKLIRKETSSPPGQSHPPVKLVLPARADVETSREADTLVKRRHTAAPSASAMPGSSKAAGGGARLSAQQPAIEDTEDSDSQAHLNPTWYDSASYYTSHSVYSTYSDVGPREKKPKTVHDQTEQFVTELDPSATEEAMDMLLRQQTRFIFGKPPKFHKSTQTNAMDLLPSPHLKIIYPTSYQPSSDNENISSMYG